MAGVGFDTKIYPTENYDRVTFSSDKGGAGPSTMSEFKRHQQERYYEVQTSLTLEEARYSEMRKKIPGLGRIPRDRINTQTQDSEFQKVTYIILCQSCFLLVIFGTFFFFTNNGNLLNKETFVFTWKYIEFIKYVKPSEIYIDVL